MTRSEARRHAFHLIFQIPFAMQTGHSHTEALAQAKQWYYESIDSLTDIDGFSELSRPKGKFDAYITRAIWGVLDKMQDIDGVIENFLREWEIERINRVDLAIMRLAIYEMLRELDVPLGVAANEAVQLAKEYGADESPAFVNGVLGNVAREIKEKGREQVG